MLDAAYGAAGDIGEAHWVTAAARAAYDAAQAAGATESAKADATDRAVNAFAAAGQAVADSYSPSGAADVIRLSHEAASDDVKHLLSSSPDWRKGVMSRPLWPTGEPQSWRSLVDDWGADLTRLGLNDVYQRHVKHLNGTGVLHAQDLSQTPERIEQDFSLGQSLDVSTVPADKQLIDRTGAPTATADAPTPDDRLDRRPLVRSLAAMFSAREQATPFTLGLLGDWGAGKSSVMEQLRTILGDSGHAVRSVPRGSVPPYEFLFARFNAWQYEHTDDIRAGLAQEVVKGLTDDLNPLKRQYLKFRFACREHRWEFWKTVISGILAVAVGSSVFWLPWESLLKTDFVRDLVGAGVVFGGLAIPVYLWKTYKPIFDHPLATKLQTYLKLPDYGKHLGMVPVLRKHIKTLCELRGVKEEKAKARLVVFVDDLDRCNQECITQTLDAVRLVMEIPNVIVVLAMDYRIAFAAVAKHYASLTGADRGAETARDYFGKIIQLPVELPQPTDMKSFIRTRLFGTVDEADVEVLAQRRDLQSTREMTEAIFQAETLDESPDDRAAVPGGIEAIADPSEPEREQSIPKVMQETAMDCRLFEKWTGSFRFHNPRQLIRLRNTYRLLTQLDHARDHTSDDNQRMAMLFWLEFLYEKNAKDRELYEQELLPSVGVIDGKPVPEERERIADEITEMGIRGVVQDLGSESDQIRFEYERLKRHIGRFVLPFGDAVVSTRS